MSMKRLRAKADKVGVELEDTGEALEIWSPKGFTLDATGCHCMVQQYLIPNNGAWTAALMLNKPFAIKVVMDGLAAGLRPCDQKPCDICDGY